MKHLLMLGRAGVGKTTLVTRLVSAVRELRVEGFVTEALLEHGQRVGVWLSAMDGRQVLLAHRHWEPVKDVTAFSRVGPYRVNVSVLDHVAVPVLQRALTRAGLVVLDELGTMTLCSERMERIVERAFDDGPPIVATGSLVPVPLVERLKRRRDVELIPVTLANRDVVSEELCVRWRARASRDPAVAEAQRQADRICEMIVSGMVAQVDIDIQQAVLREQVARLPPEQGGNYVLGYEQRFRRLWQQSRIP